MHIYMKYTCMDFIYCESNSITKKLKTGEYEINN